MADNLTISAEQLAERWCVTKQTLQQWRKKQLGPDYFQPKPGFSVRYFLDSVEAIESAGRIESQEVA